MSSKTLDHKCPACRAVINWNPSIEKFKCEYCDSEYTLEQMKNYENASKDVYNDGIKGDDTQFDEYKCNNCGAEIIADDQTSATFCIYCGNTAILKNKLSGKFAPTYVIPFKKTREEAIEKFINIKKGRPLVPKDFNDKKNIDKIRGIYIPFWLFDVKVDGEISAICKKVTTWSSGDYLFTKTDTYDVERKGTYNYTKIPIDGSTRFDDSIMSTLEPFNFEELEKYNHAYLSGFLAEKYDVNEQESFKRANERAKIESKNQLFDSIHGYTSKVIKNENLSSFNEKIDYVLLPVYMVNVKYKNKMHVFAMNGQTGEFIGDIPIDRKKTAFIGISIFLVVFLICLLSAYLFFLGGAV